ncbi:TIGR03032 family protein [Brevibacillus humidisoli]|uniref:DUF4915 domain-containing protein n=1 Tax=Brevibacillus humidisoli TaxID=2895522 RepID=UPI001E579664|nr:DUF4915 domain-containing protein [Brevibacillus humidisoli]UFJ42521.1 TIGR03032 family protein [Brevibacillus humidisoli]
MYENLRCKLLVTCCNEQGGLYQILFQKNTYSVTKVQYGHFTGIAKYRDQYVIANPAQVFLFDRQFQVLAASDEIYLDIHGVAVYKDNAFVVETMKNSIGIYDLPSLKRSSEIRFHPSDIDVYHINDLYVAGDRLFISMFSPLDEWLPQCGHGGVIVEYDLLENKVKKIHHDHLNQPHSVLYHDGQIFYCNSRPYEVKRGGEVIFTTASYTRGLAINAPYLFVGQSISRNMGEEATEAAKNHGMICGIYVFNYVERASEFISLPSREVYGMVIE